MDRQAGGRAIPDDPAIWVNRGDASKSLVLGTMKVAAPDGALAEHAVGHALEF